MASQQEGEGEEYTSIEMEDSLVTSITEKMGKLHPISPDICIYRAPQGVRQLNEKAYTPQKVSIGPLHHGKENLLPMEEQKLRYLSAFLDRTNLSLERCLSFIRGLEDSVRNCYVESINLSSDEFVEMILVDSSFIIEVIWRCKYNQDKTDFLSKPITLVDVVMTDMILLENQIPLFVLEDLFNLAFPSHSEVGDSSSHSEVGDSSFVSLSIEYFKDVLLFHDHEIPNPGSNSPVEHFVDLLRLCHLSSTPRPLPPNRVSFVNSLSFVAIPAARDLQQVGLSFKMESSNNIFDIQYVKQVLRIPHFRIQDSSEILLRNLIAFEMCHYLRDSYIIDYVVFMNNLMDNAQDVDILVQNGILENWLEDRASVATLFHNLWSGVLLDPSNYYYRNLCQEVNAYCKVPWHKWKAIMKHDYFSSPWRIVSVLAAIVLLVLTLIQTVCSVISILK